MAASWRIRVWNWTLNFRIINNMGAGNKKGFMWRFDPQLGQVFNKLDQ